MPVADKERRKLTPPEVARQFGCNVERIHAWIRRGELRAMNAAIRADGKPRFLIDVADLEAFERSRAVTPPEKTVRRPRRPQRPPGYVYKFNE